MNHSVSADHQFANGIYFTSALVLKFSAFLAVMITSLIQSPSLEVIATSPTNKQIVEAFYQFWLIFGQF